MSSRTRTRRNAKNVLALLVAAVMIFPVYWMFATSLKTPGQILSDVPQFIPWPPSVENFRRALDQPEFWTFARNSLVVSLSTVALSMLIALGASIAVVRFSFRGRRLFLVVLVLVQMIPQSAMIIPIYLMLRSVNALDFLPGLVATYLTFVLPFTIWTLRGFVAGVPVELEEAAMVDGCSRLRAFVQILLPLLMPGVVATSIFAFVSAWDDYLFAYVLMKSQGNYTLPVWLVSFQTQEGVDYGAMIAASSIFSVPVLVFFLFVQRRLVGGMTGGAVKE
ncbi:carbohydrate ABC transporter permease [Saccharopolyspora sp. K220]|uniref:carbohydrate ABC transporter permease n=1 Tax=Saccharopolyspora soli TaxID=2926618 RepID=UPI001F5ADCCD|nr:carbohydrate ABC transporter permease [Saccharopolyspora soli]MCI2417001.1 carbohydrate ABC transporter permease [Saccharopolyspora soli]